VTLNSEDRVQSPTALREKYANRVLPRAGARGDAVVKARAITVGGEVSGFDARDEEVAGHLEVAGEDDEALLGGGGAGLAVEDGAETVETFEEVVKILAGGLGAGGIVGLVDAVGDGAGREGYGVAGDVGDLGQDGLKGASERGAG
jgi:hypothetical protein